MAEDFAAIINIHYPKPPVENPGAFKRGWADWAERYSLRAKRLGANGVMMSEVGLHDLPLDRETYEAAMNILTNSVATWRRKDGTPHMATKRRWEDSAVAAGHLRKTIDALHGDGMAVYYWGVAQGHVSSEAQFDPAWRKMQARLTMGMAEMGFDAVWHHVQNHEGPMLHPEMVKKHGREYWKWDRAGKERFYRDIDGVLEDFRETRRRVKSKYPWVKQVAWGYDAGQVDREMYTIDLAGDLDLVQLEMLDGAKGTHEHSKYGIARIRGMFNNRRCTPYHHYFVRHAGDAWRTGNCDMPFVYGANGFTQEGDDYAWVDPEIVETSGDFFRFVRHSGLNRIVERMTMVRNWAVMRDAQAQREDIFAGRHKRGFCDHGHAHYTHTDGMASYWINMRALQADLVLDKFFTAENLKGYKALVVPHNRSFTERDWGTVERFVKEGGVCYADGAEFPFAGRFTEGAEKVEREGGLKLSVKRLGKGMLIYSAEENSLDRKKAAAVREAVAEIGGVRETVDFAKPWKGHVDAMVRTDGEKYFVGTYGASMPGGTGAVVTATLDLPGAGEGWVALDAKNGKLGKYDGTLRYRQEYRQCSYFLIGPADKVKLPEHTVAEAGDYGARKVPEASEPAKKNMAAREAQKEFRRPLRAVVFRNLRGEGVERITRYQTLGVDCRSVVAPAEELKRRFRTDTLEEWHAANPGVHPYAKAECAELLATATLLHLKCDPKACDAVFEDCAEEIKAMLARGGAILFDQTPTPPKAKKFLAEIGVRDPNLEGGRVTGWGELGNGMNAQFTGEKTHPIWCVPEALDKPWTGAFLQHGAVYAKWDAEKQWAPFTAKSDGTRAMVVMQENVLGKGKVCFSENTRAFTDWYESETFGNNMLSYLMGMNMLEHVKKVELLNGGPGNEVR